MQPGSALKQLPMGIAAVGVSPRVPDSGTSLRREPEAIPRAWKRDEAAHVVALHFEFIWRLLRRLGVAEHDVDDAAQQVFLTATTKGIRSTPAQARPFLYGVALRVAANYRRSVRRRREVSEEAMGDPHSPDLAADDVADLRRARAVLDEILDEMPLELRVVFILSEIEQMTAASIAELESIPAGTVASRLRRAREIFRARLAAAANGDADTGGDR
jgi:RNA polymerase sigma-70 factor (ECF subfamily)